MPFSMSRGMALALDRKSTRLNSSHGYISYAVFCLKKKKLNTPSKERTTTCVGIPGSPLPSAQTAFTTTWYLVPAASLSVLFFFFNDTATTEIYTLSLHDALPIFVPAAESRSVRSLLGNRNFDAV